MARHVPDGAHVLSVERRHLDSPRKLVLEHRALAAVPSREAARVAAPARIGEAAPPVVG